MGATNSPSPALLAANQRLLQRRAQLKTKGVSAAAAPCRQTDNAPDARPAVLPAHLGWGSAAVTAVLRAAPSPTGAAAEAPPWWQPAVVPQQPEAPALPDRQPVSPSEVRLYPDLAAAMLRRGNAGAGRVWLLLRHLDENGRGWLPLADVQRRLTDRHSEWRICGSRQLRNLLHQGEGIFWQRDHENERIWLRAVAKVAVALAVPRLRLRPVLLAPATLTQKLADVKAHFYASFHSSRRSDQPISRETLATLTGVPPRTQREYERRTGIKARHNVAVGEAATPAAVQERAWRQGTAFFTFVDFLGKQGPAGTRYTAWHLPNSYAGCHRPAPRGRMRKINQHIDLVNKRARGNSAGVDRLFFLDGARAGSAYRRNTAVDRYWPAGVPTRSQTRLWAVFAALKSQPARTPVS